MDAENEEKIKQLVHDKYKLQTKLVSTKENHDTDTTVMVPPPRLGLGSLIAA